MRSKMRKKRENGKEIIAFAMEIVNSEGYHKTVAKLTQKAQAKILFNGGTSTLSG